jgi:hypothetical protein
VGHPDGDTHGCVLGGLWTPQRFLACAFNLQPLLEAPGPRPSTSASHMVDEPPCRLFEMRDAVTGQETSMRKRLTPSSRRAGGADLGYTGPPRTLPRKPQERRRSLQKLTTSRKPAGSVASPDSDETSPLHADLAVSCRPQTLLFACLNCASGMGFDGLLWLSPFLGVGFQWRWSREPHAFGVVGVELD